jgi:hypothetical protein
MESVRIVFYKISPDPSFPKRGRGAFFAKKGQLSRNGETA